MKQESKRYAERKKKEEEILTVNVLDKINFMYGSLKW